MDNCFLEKLLAKPHQINPIFNKNCTNYNIILLSNSENVTLDYLTQDSGASTLIKLSSSANATVNGKTITLEEGTNVIITIEVTAEDGKSTKNYAIHTTRLSSKEAVLNNLTLSCGTLIPNFASSILEYKVILSPVITNLRLSPTVHDSKCTILIQDEENNFDIALNFGKSCIAIKVFSVDKSINKTYQVYVTKTLFPLPILFEDNARYCEFEDPFSLSAIQEATSIVDCQPKQLFSHHILKHYTMKSKFDPINNLPLGLNFEMHEKNVDEVISNCMGYFPSVYRVNTVMQKICDLGKCLLETVPLVIQSPDFKTFTHVTDKHVYQEKKWEKALEKYFEQDLTAQQLIAQAEKYLTAYFDALPENAYNVNNYNENESPLQCLNNAIYCYVAAIKLNVKDANLHTKLAMVLEEKYYAQDMYSFNDNDDDGDQILASVTNSCEEDEIQAICRLHSVPSSASLAIQLKALDKEFHTLLDQGQSARADAVQTLFLWKSKQANAEGRTAQKAASEESPLGQAFVKYLDAFSLEDTKADRNYHVGRLLVAQGKYDEAITRLESALSWNNKHPTARFYLGFALAARKNGPQERNIEATTYLLEGCQSLFNALKLEFGNVEHPKKKCLLAENQWRITNTFLLKGFNMAGQLLRSGVQIKEAAMAPKEAFHTAAYLASVAIISVAKGDILTQLEWVLLDAHSALLDMVSRVKERCDKVIEKRCRNLSALIRLCSIPMNDVLLDMQEKASQNLVFSSSNNSISVYQLGISQFARAEATMASEKRHKQALQEALASFETAISLEGQPSQGGTPPLAITEQYWWKERLLKESMKAQTTNSSETSAARGGTSAARGGISAARGGTPAARGGTSAARGGTSAARGGTPAARGGTSAARGGTSAARGGTPAARGGTSAARGGTPAARGGTSAARGGTPAARGSSSSTRGGPPSARGGTSTARSVTIVSCEDHISTCKDTRAVNANDKKVESESMNSSSNVQTTSQTSSAEPILLNKTSYLPRLGIARIHRLEGKIEDARIYYEKVINMAPELHDAYIESADMLMATEPLKAVDIFCRFPVSGNDELTFDDAFIFGEIVRILMKNEKFDDPRLPTFMIKWGKILGLGILEKYITILENKLKTALCKKVYAGVHNKSEDDKDLQAFFKMKFWT